MPCGIDDPVTPVYTLTYMSTNHKQRIIEAAIDVASRPGGWASLTRQAVAARAGCSDGLVSQHCGTMEQFKRDIMRHAIRSRHLSIIAQGLAAGDPRAKRAPPDLKGEALATLAT